MDAIPTPVAPSERVRIRQRAQRGRYDRASIHAILAEGLVAHVAFVDGGTPLVIPVAYAVDGDTLYLHGAAGGRLMRALLAGGDICVTVTLLDGLVLAKSAFHHSMNYRSVVIVGKPREVTDDAEKERAFLSVVEHIVPGRSRDARPPTAAERAATRMVALPLREASAKARSGPPVDDAEDLALPVWTGVLSLETVYGTAVPDAAAIGDIPEYVVAYERPGG